MQRFTLTAHGNVLMENAIKQLRIAKDMDSASSAFMTAVDVCILYCIVKSSDSGSSVQQPIKYVAMKRTYKNTAHPKTNPTKSALKSSSKFEIKKLPEKHDDIECNIC